jgi:hypothetical protein
MTVAQKEFPAASYRQLVHDVAAARSFLDNENDANQLNSRNLIIIGAGRGATIGMMWMDQEFKRYKAQVNPTLNPLAPPVLRSLDTDPAGDDVAAAIWLSPNPTIAGTTYATNTHKWMAEVGGKGTGQHKVPMAFVYGSDDASQAQILSFMKNIANDSGQAIDKPIKGLEFTQAKLIKAKLAGSKLLHENLDTADWIIKDYLDPLMAKRGITQWKAKGNDDQYFYWKSNPLPVLAKAKGDKVPKAVPANILGLVR